MALTMSGIRDPCLRLRTEFNTNAADERDTPAVRFSAAVLPCETGPQRRHGATNSKNRKAISEQFNTRPMHIPFLESREGDAIAHPMGAKQLNLAIFRILTSARARADLLESVRIAVGADGSRCADREDHDQNMLVYMVEG